MDIVTKIETSPKNAFDKPTKPCVVKAAGELE